MATDNSILTLSFISESDLHTNFGCFVVADTDANQVDIAGDGDPAIGVLTNKPNAGEVANVAIHGVARVLVGTDGITANGDFVASDANGAAVTADSGDYILGVCIDKGNGAGTYATILQKSFGKAA